MIMMKIPGNTQGYRVGVIRGL